MGGSSSGGAGGTVHATVILLLVLLFGCLALRANGKFIHLQIEPSLFVHGTMRALYHRNRERKPCMFSQVVIL
jgi:hypothetical protein